MALSLRLRRFEHLRVVQHPGEGPERRGAVFHLIVHDRLVDVAEPVPFGDDGLGLRRIRVQRQGGLDAGIVVDPGLGIAVMVEARSQSFLGGAPLASCSPWKQSVSTRFQAPFDIVPSLTVPRPRRPCFR